MEWNTFSTQEKCQDGFETDEQADELGGPGGRSGNQAFASASLILAILSVISFLVFFISIPLGALAIVFSLLSRGDGLMQARARISVILSAIALAASIFLTSYAVYQIVTNPLLQSEKAYITPHIAWASIEARERLAAVAIGNVRAFVEGKPRNVVSK